MSKAWLSVFRRHAFPLSLALLSLLLQLAPDNWLRTLRYERTAVVHGEMWRWLSAHFIHLNWTHWLFNLVGLGLVWVLFATRLRQAQWWMACLWSIIAIDLGVYFFNPAVDWYVGTSGLLHGLFAAGAVASLRQSGWRSGIYLLLLVVKIGWEQFAGALPGSATAIGARVVIEAHFYGAVSGALFAAFLPMRSQPTGNTRISADG